jgi:hypothetical protein
MSFEVYVQCFENGEPSGISREFLREVFGAALSEPKPDYWHLAYGPNESCELALSALPNTPEKIHSITVERPCTNSQLWQGLARLLANNNATLYFPGSSAPLVHSRTAGNHLPSDMLAALGNPIVVASGSDILRHVSSA